MSTLGDILGKNKGYQKLLSDKRLLDRVKRSWECASGRLSKQLKPVSIHRGVLSLETENPMWKTELAFYEDKVLAKLEEVLKKKFVKKLKVQIASASKKEELKRKEILKNRTFEEKIRDSVMDKIKQGYSLCTTCSSVYVKSRSVCDFCRISFGK